MKIELKEISIRELAEGYEEKVKEEGVFGYNGRLDIRPPYQREFIYKDNQQQSVIDTILNNYPLNIMYWAVREDGNYEVIDGQQRTISICKFIDGQFAYKKRYYHNLQKDEKEIILNYKLSIYLCSGTDSEKLKWFERINIAGEKLTDQELKNAVFSGSWVSDANRFFSKTGCLAYKIGNQYLTGIPIRQDYLETAIKWISNDNILKYMGEHQHDPDANELWLYFQNVINWAKAIFPKYRNEMEKVQWGFLYNEFKDKIGMFANSILQIDKLTSLEDEDDFDCIDCDISDKNNDEFFGI